MYVDLQYTVMFTLATVELISFDIIFRYLQHIGYNVRYVRNITDVGHLEDTGEDKISKKAKIEQLEPMEIAQKYTCLLYTSDAADD